MKLNCIFDNKFTKRNNMLIVINKFSQSHLHHIRNRNNIEHRTYEQNIVLTSAIKQSIDGKQDLLCSLCYLTNRIKINDKQAALN